MPTIQWEKVSLMSKSACAFLITFVVTQKLLPVVYQKGEFSNMAGGDVLAWLLSMHSLQISVVFGLLLTIVYVYPLVRLPRSVSLIAGASTGLLVGVLAYPLDLVEAGVWPEWAEPTLLSVWLIGTIGLWSVALTRRAQP